MDRIQAFRLFIRIVDLGSFSKAAADLRMGQPVGHQAGGRSWKSTSVRACCTARPVAWCQPRSALLYYDKCKLIAHHLEEADSVAALMQSQLQGGLRISTSVAFGRRVLVPLVVRFMKLNPKLQIDLSFRRPLC